MIRYTTQWSNFYFFLEEIIYKVGDLMFIF